MIMNLAVIVLVLVLAYTWALRGFFNALLHLVATIVGGAIAFAVWEHVSLLIVSVSPQTGFLRFVGGVAWSAGLLVPFAVATLIVRTILDKIIRANIGIADSANMVGGGLCGLAIGVLTIGMVVIGVNGTRFGAAMLGYKPLWYNPERIQGGGSLKMSDSLWVPVDRLTGALYSGLSRHAFSSSEPLGKWYPDLHAAVYANRIAPEGDSPRTAYAKDDVSLLSRYSVGAPGGSPVRDLLTFDQDGQGVSQPYADTHGEAVASGTVEGFVLSFNASAKDPARKGAGQVVMSNGQARLVCRAGDGSTFNVFPVAMISQAASSDNVYGRWRYEAEGDFFASVGGASTVNLALEFVVPAGAEPLGLFVKGVRLGLEGGPQPTRYATRVERDSVVAGGSILRGQKPRETIDTSNAVQAEAGNRNAAGATVLVTNTLGGRMVLHVQVAKRGFSLDEDNRISSGFNQFTRADLQNTPQSDNLRVDRFAVSRDQVIVQVQMSGESSASLLRPDVRLINADEPLRIIDTNGLSYEAIGFIYEDRTGIQVRYNPAEPLTGTRDLPALSSSRTDQDLRVIFLVSYGVDAQYVAIGDKAVLVFDPPLGLDERQP